MTQTTMQDPRLLDSDALGDLESKVALGDALNRLRSNADFKLVEAAYKKEADMRLAQLGMMNTDADYRITNMFAGINTRKQFEDNVFKSAERAYNELEDHKDALAGKEIKPLGVL